MLRRHRASNAKHLIYPWYVYTYSQWVFHQGTNHTRILDSVLSGITSHVVHILHSLAARSLLIHLAFKTPMPVIAVCTSCSTSCGRWIMVSVKGSSQVRIFMALGVPWWCPSLRRCWKHQGNTTTERLESKGIFEWSLQYLHPIFGRNAKKLLHILLLSKPLSVNTNQKSGSFKMNGSSSKVLCSNTLFIWSTVTPNRSHTSGKELSWQRKQTWSKINSNLPVGDLFK